jgi:hypothetical protein
MNRTQNTTVINWDSVCSDTVAFTAALFLLEWGADRFIDHTAIVARRLGVSQTLVALLTAGAEWEEVRSCSGEGTERG